MTKQQNYLVKTLKYLIFQAFILSDISKNILCNHTNISTSIYNEQYIQEFLKIIFPDL